MHDPSQSSGTTLPQPPAETDSAGLSSLMLGQPPKLAAAPKRARSGRNWQMPVALACVLLGVSMVLMFRTQSSQGFPLQSQYDDRARFVRMNDDLSRLVKYLESEKEKLLVDLNDTKQALARQLDSPGEGPKTQATIQSLKDELQKAQLQAGLVAVQGQGIQVTLNDSPRQPGPGEDPYYFLIHDVDIQAFVNELWAAGAEAVAVNDQRLVTQSSVRCVGPTILVNSSRMAPPYSILAIGSPKDLETALTMPGGVLHNLEQSMKNGVQIQIVRQNKLVLPAYKGAAGLRYVEPVPEGGG